MTGCQSVIFDKLPAPRQAAVCVEDNMNIHISYEYLYVERRHDPDLGR